MTAAAHDDFFSDYWENVKVGFGPRAPQNRVSVGLRLGFVLPHLLVLVVLTAVSVVLAVVGWAAALKLGRLPRPIAVYQMRWVAYYARVNAYLFLLGDDYPPFSLTVADYPVRVEIVASRLSGPAVLFRLVLLVPAFVISVVSLTGLVLISPIVWVMTLFSRQMPPPFFTATAAVIRYHTRAIAYAVMVTAEYPQQLFGDRDGEALGDELRLAISPEAKRLLIAVLIVGSLASSLGAARLVIGGDPGEAALNRLEAGSVVFKRSVSRCPDGPDRFHCLEQAERTWSGAWDQYTRDINSGYVFPFSPQKRQAVRVIDASSPVIFALLDSSRAKTASAHVVAYENVLKLIRHFDTVLRRSRLGVPSSHLLVGGG